MASQLWFERALLPSGWADAVAVTVAEGKIAAIATDAPPGAAERYGPAAPGLANVHSHTFQRGMAGLAEARGPTDDDFWTWREWMYTFLDRLTPEDIEAIAAQAFVEMLETGFTRVGEFHYLHHDADGAAYDDLAQTSRRICAAAAETGIGLTLLPVFYAQGGFGGQAATPGQRRFLNDIDRFEALFEASSDAVAQVDGGVIGLAPHSLRAVTPSDLARLVAAHPQGPVHIHVAEQVKEVDDCLAWCGQRPVAWLLDHAPVDRRWCLIHATHIDPQEVARVAASGAVVGLCPLTEANLGDGVFPAADYAAAGGRFGIGTDSNVQIDAAGELRLMEYAQRLSRRARNVLGSPARPHTGAALFDAALQGGGQALGAGAGLAVGNAADILVFEVEAPSLAGRDGDALLDSWIFAGARREVAHVWRAGVRVVTDGRHHQREAIARRYASTIARLIN